MSSPKNRSSGARDSVIPDVVRSISQAEGGDELELTPPLGVVVDTDALDRYVWSTGDDARVRFRYRDWTVTVHGDDQVEVTPTADDE